MGRRGKPPKPTALRLVEGRKQHRPLPRAEPKPKSGIPSCPKHLDKEAKKEYRRVSKELLSLGLLTIVDRAALAAYCQCYSRWVLTENRIREIAELDEVNHGLITMGHYGPVMNPLIRISRDCLAQMKVFLVEFGLTPSSRTRLEVKKEEEKTLEEMLA